MNLQSTSTESGPASDSTIRTFQVLLMVAMAALALAVIGPLIDRPGLGLLGDTLPAVDAELEESVDLSELTAPEGDDRRIVNRDTEVEPAEIGAPVSARFTFTQPSVATRVVWTGWTMLGPLLALIGAWLVYGIVKSARHGDPFIAANVRRLHLLALLVSAGGTAYSMLDGAVSTLLLQASTAGDMAAVVFSVSFLPILVGAAIEALAVVWKAGVRLREDVEGTI